MSDPGSVARFVPSGNASGPSLGNIDEWIPSLNVLGHAQLIELDIGSRCGGHGICGADRVRIDPETQRSFFSAPTEREAALLSPAEISAGWRLGCQCFPNFKTSVERSRADADAGAVANASEGTGDAAPSEIRIELPAHRS